jgi:predicted nuclease of predicted toxin-antitoxin system
VSVRFYMDHNVQGAVVDALRVRGVDCLTAQEDGATTLNDDSLLARATALGRVLVTHDKDFFAIFETWWTAGRKLTGIVQSLPTQITIGQLIEDLHFIAEAAEPEEMQNSLIRLPL